MKLIEELEKVAREVDEYILSLVKGRPKILYDASSHLIKTGGKRLRPFLVMKSFEIFDDDKRKAISVASSIELLHNFTLVHDDIMDNDLLRHGASSVHAKYGVPFAILAGDVLFTKVFESIVIGMRDSNVNNDLILRVLELTIQASLKVCEGQAKDLTMTSKKHFFPPRTYSNMIKEKTATLFETACRVGSLVGGATKKDEEAMSNFGQFIGIAFQMIDDILGVVGESNITGKPVGNDLKEGKKTYVISLSLELTKDAEKNKILRVFGNKNAEENEVKEALNIISKSGAVDKVKEEATLYVDKARLILEKYNKSKSYEVLSELTKFVINRKL